MARTDFGAGGRDRDRADYNSIRDGDDKSGIGSRSRSPKIDVSHCSRSRTSVQQHPKTSNLGTNTSQLGGTNSYKKPTKDSYTSQKPSYYQANTKNSLSPASNINREPVKKQKKHSHSPMPQHKSRADYRKAKERELLYKWAPGI